jgi:capsular polysaccharide export protein
MTPQKPANPRCFLFLQGPQSAFFRRLGRALGRLGHRVIKVNFCGGDMLHWLKPDTRLFRGGAKNWNSWVAGLMDREGVTDLLLFGDWRPLHREAVLLGQARGVRLWVFEEGYLRPNYVTMEEGGVNGTSRLPQSPEDIRALAASLPEPEEPPHYPNPLRRRVLDAIGYHAASALLWPLFWRYRTHRPQNILRELMGWIPRYLGRKGRREHAARQLSTFLDSGAPFYFFPLQLDADSQVRRYSPFSGMRESIAFIVSDFARNAPQHMHLLIKNHPLDNGLVAYANYTADFARASGVGERVHFVDSGDTDLILSRTRGVVLLNSTLGLSALLRRLPVYCLGRSIYALPGLATEASQLPLSEFWTALPAPDMSLAAYFRRVLVHKALAPGNFYSAPGVQCCVARCLRRLEVLRER